jgi:hypothetical protein
MKPLPRSHCHLSRGARKPGSRRQLNHHNSIRLKETPSHRDPNGSEKKNKAKLEEDICIHIFTVSSAMVGVCLTVIGLIRVVITLGKIDTLADDLLAGDALLFLVSSLLSYSALRSRSLGRMHRIERAADWIFITAMIIMTAICGLITYTMTMPNHH